MYFVLPEHIPLPSLDSTDNSGLNSLRLYTAEYTQCMHSTAGMSQAVQSHQGKNIKLRSLDRGTINSYGMDGMSWTPLVQTSHGTRGRRGACSGFMAARPHGRTRDACCLIPLQLIALQLQPRYKNKNVHAMHLHNIYRVISTLLGPVNSRYKVRYEWTSRPDQFPYSFPEVVSRGTPQ